MLCTLRWSCPHACLAYAAAGLPHPSTIPPSLIQRHAKARTYMPEDTLLGYFVQLVAALAHVHAVGILHRDIKTNNVFMTGQGLLKLADFGISKVRQTSARVHVLHRQVNC
jgi:serine/threonine protein kinase